MYRPWGDSGGPVHPLLLSRWCGGHRSHLRNRLSAIAPEHVTFMQPSSLLPQTNSRGGVCIPLSSQWISSTWRRGQKKDAEEHEGSSHTWWGWSERGFRRQWLLRVARQIQGSKIKVVDLRPGWCRLAPSDEQAPRGAHSYTFQGKPPTPNSLNLG